MNFEQIIASRANKARNLEDLAWLLERFLQECEVVEHNGETQLIFKRARVGQIGGLKIEIYANEHAPPHFHVKSNEIDAVFTISDCKLLKGTVSSKDERLINYWHSGSKSKLVEMWNRMRPANCPVGQILNSAASISDK
jgi:hypothetical protein